MTLESGGRLSGFGEVKPPAVETESELPLGEEINEPSAGL
jgi:hypothetical protein